jgi:hypothetical protein
VYTDTSPPDAGVAQDRVTLPGLTDEAARLYGCPGTTVADIPALTEMKIAAPPEYVTPRMVAH